MPDHDLPDPDAPVTDEELGAAERLRSDLEGSTTTSEEAELANALRAAWDPGDLPAAEHRALVARALGRRARPVARVTLARVAVVALAAGVALALVRKGSYGPDASSTALAVSRSTQDLFRERFAAAGGETERIDRIAVARATDLRENEFAKWGVR
jgi:hypothetical protein